MLEDFLLWLGLGTNGWPENSIQVPLVSHLSKRSSARHAGSVRCLSNNDLHSFSFRPCVGFVLPTHLPGSTPFVNTSHGELRLFGFVCVISALPRLSEQD